MSAAHVAVMDGCYKDLRVVGVSGTFDANDTPALCEPIYSDAHNAVLLRASLAPVPSDARSVLFDTMPYTLDGHVIPGLATTLPTPIEPARVGHVLFVFGPRERQLERKLRQEPDVAPIVERVMRSSDQRVGEVELRYLSVQEANVLRAAIAKVLRQQLLDACGASAQWKQDDRVRALSFHLARACTKREDDALAAYVQREIAEARGQKHPLWRALLTGDSSKALTKEHDRLLAEAERDVREASQPRLAFRRLRLRPLAAVDVRAA